MHAAMIVLQVQATRVRLILQDVRAPGRIALGCRMLIARATCLVNSHWRTRLCKLATLNMRMWRPTFGQTVNRPARHNTDPLHDLHVIASHHKVLLMVKHQTIGLCVKAIMRAYSMLRLVRRTYSSTRIKRVDPDRGGPKTVGLSYVRALEREEEECFFPTLRQMQVQTADRCHQFSVPCDKTIQFIKLGAINKQIALQYCHYLAHLAKTSNDQNDIQYYSSRCTDLLAYLLKNGQDIPTMAKNQLLCDVAPTSKDSCVIAIKNFLAMDRPTLSYPRQFADLFGSCVKFLMWSEAQELLARSNHTLLTFRICDSLVDGLEIASEQYQKLADNSSEKRELRCGVIETIMTICEYFRKYRVQFIVKRRDDLMKFLIDLDIKATAGSQIKMSGRCTHCKTNLPFFNDKDVSDINAAIRDKIFEGAEKGLYLNTSPSDASRFEKFLIDLNNLDRKPIDCVVDGLNIAYRTSSGYSWIKQNLGDDVTRSIKVPKVESQTQTLINSIIRGNLLTKFKKILVVGKAHMTKWPGLMDFLHSNKIHFYSSYNNSKDDLFQLYASTRNHKTVLITNDFLRDHLASLDYPVRVLLERWIDTHQAWICQNTLKPIWPTPYEKIASVDREKGVFHLPVIDFNQLESVGVTEPPPHLNNKGLLVWFCCETSKPVGE